VFDSRRNRLGVIFVDPEFQDRGVGQRIWEFVESTYPETESWQLETPGFTTKNHHFYEKCGFRRVEVKPPQDDFPWESWVYRKECGAGA
jgi:GNAT superfamily N-acetyltransferase